MERLQLKAKLTDEVCGQIFVSIVVLFRTVVYAVYTSGRRLKKPECSRSGNVYWYSIAGFGSLPGRQCET